MKIHKCSLQVVYCNLPDPLLLETSVALRPFTPDVITPFIITFPGTGGGVAVKAVTCRFAVRTWLENPGSIGSVSVIPKLPLCPDAVTIEAPLPVVIEAIPRLCALSVITG